MAYYWLTRNADEKETRRFKAQLEQPPRWADPDEMSEESKAADGAAFLAAMGAGGNGVRS